MTATAKSDPTDNDHGCFLAKRRGFSAALLFRARLGLSYLPNPQPQVSLTRVT